MYLVLNKRLILFIERLPVEIKSVNSDNSSPFLTIEQEHGKTLEEESIDNSSSIIDFKNVCSSTPVQNLSETNDSEISPTEGN